MNWPKDLTPEFYFDNLRSDVRVMWQPVNQRAYAETGPPDFKMLNARTAAPETATVRLADDMAPFRVAINSPGFLRFFERGPFTLADVKDGILEIELEQPAAVDLRFDTSATPAEQLPFDTAAFMVMRKTLAKARTFPSQITARWRWVKRYDSPIWRRVSFSFRSEPSPRPM